MKKILVIRTHRLGDVLQLTPMLAGLKARHPAAAITLVTGDSLADLIGDQPFIDEFVSIPESKYRHELSHRPISRPHVYHELYDGISALRARHFDLAINRQYETGALISYLTGAKDIRGGAFSPEQGFYFTDNPSSELYEIIKKDRKKNTRNLVDWNCLIAGLDPGCTPMNIRLSAADRWEAAELLSAYDLSPQDGFIAVQMGAARAFRHWGVDHYAALLTHLTLEKKRQVVLLGTQDEKALVDAVKAKLLPDMTGLIDLTGKTSLRVLGGVLECCRLLITGDTGTMHLAAAVGTPVLAIFYGTAYPWETGPYGCGHLVLFADEPCAPCVQPDDCPTGQHCRQTIKPEHVCTAFEISECLRTGSDCSGEIDAAWMAPLLEGNVRLFLTQVDPGTGQRLVPINAETARGRLKTEERQMIDFAGLLPDYLQRLQRYESDLLQDYYGGDRESFTGTFSRYVDQWLRLVQYVNKANMERTIRDALSVNLMPILQQATQAMQDEDVVSLKDIVQNELSGLIAILGERKNATGSVEEF